MIVPIPPWRLVVPVKRLDLAKTRLTPVDDAVRASLALAFAGDVVDAALASPSIARIGVVTSDARVAAAMPPSVSVVEEAPGGDLNDAIRTAADRLGGGPIAVVPADLPALTSADLTAALDAAASTGDRSFVSDVDGMGTVFAAAIGVPLRPRFGDASATRHRRDGAGELHGDWPGLRRDVDTVDHLRAAIRIGVGARTAAVLARVRLPP